MKYNQNYLLTFIDHDNIFIITKINLGRVASYSRTAARPHRHVIFLDKPQKLYSYTKGWREIQTKRKKQRKKERKKEKLVQSKLVDQAFILRMFLYFETFIKIWIWINRKLGLVRDKDRI